MPLLALSAMLMSLFLVAHSTAGWAAHAVAIGVTIVAGVIVAVCGDIG